jgi:hypothetical protein
MNEMTCKSGVKVLAEYLEGTLAGDVRAAVSPVCGVHSVLSRDAAPCA